MNQEEKLSESPYESALAIRVRYQETDQMGVVYHGNYFAWFEMGRTEYLRETTGMSYQDLENANILMVIIKAECSYHKPAHYDEVLTLKTRLLRLTRVRIEHEYRLYRDEELLATGHTILATVDRTGKIIPVPASLLDPSAKNENSKK
ncbi:MAG: thioesterase family protein [Planctomycetia bacterium]|nr:thioesterase family protein [Planctomycetia bacterium]